MKFSDWPLENVRLECKQCGQVHEMPRAALQAIYGDMDMFSFRMDYVACKSDGSCKMIYPDAFLVDAILEPDPEQVLKKELIEEGLRLRKELGIKVEKKQRQEEPDYAREFA